MAAINFDATEIEPTSSFEPIPAGKYTAVVIDSITKPTKNGTGEYLEFTLEIVDGPHKGRRIWERMTIRHPNETTVKIARGNLAALCRAVDVVKPRDTAELHNLPMTITVALRKREDTGDMVNTIKGYSRREAGSAPVRTSVAGGTTPPWKR